MKYFLVLTLSIIMSTASTPSIQSKLILIDKKEKEFLSMLQTEYVIILEKREKERLETLRQEKIRYALEHETSFLAVRLKALVKSHLSYVSLLIEKEEKRQAEIRRVAKIRQRQLLAKIDISNQRMHVYKGDTLLYKWKISSGKKGHATPRGTYKATHAVAKYFSRKYNNAPMPFSVFFKSGYAIHGTKSVSRLGNPASHGCIRLHTKNAKKFYALVRKMGKKNTTIRINN